jgi:hypothetical protein
LKNQKKNKKKEEKFHRINQLEMVKILKLTTILRQLIETPILYKLIFLSLSDNTTQNFKMTNHFSVNRNQDCSTMISTFRDIKNTRRSFKGEKNGKRVDED